MHTQSEDYLALAQQALEADFHCSSAEDNCEFWDAGRGIESWLQVSELHDLSGLSRLPN